MKRALIAVSCIALMWAGCKENNPPIDFEHASIGDTTYILSTVPAAEPHHVLIEEFTGQSCSNCPSAHELLKSLEDAHPGQINVIGYYIYGTNQGNPPVGAVYDMRDSSGYRINSSIYANLKDMPSAGIDRERVGGQILQYTSSWSSSIDNQLGLADSVNLSVSSTFDTATHKATITASITYLYQTSTELNLSIAVVEDSMYDLQEFPTDVEPGYLFTNVCRGMVTSVPNGDVIGASEATKESGRFYQKVYSYTPKTVTPAIVPKKCRVIAFVHGTGSTGDSHVVQSAQCKLMQ